MKTKKSLSKTSEGMIKSREENCRVILEATKATHIEGIDWFTQTSQKVNVGIVSATAVVAFYVFLLTKGTLSFGWVGVAMIVLVFLVLISFLLALLPVQVAEINLENIVTNEVSKMDSCDLMLDMAATYKEAHIENHKSFVARNKHFYRGIYMLIATCVLIAVSLVLNVTELGDLITTLWDNIVLSLEVK